MEVWRISTFADLSGRGGILYPGRWNHRGTAIVYTADHPSTALLEMLVNVDPDLLPDRFQLLRINIPEKAGVVTANLPENWQQDTGLTRDFWQEFAEANQAPVLKVPAAVAPHAWNYLLNPGLLEEAGIVVSAVESFEIDPRFKQ